MERDRDPSRVRHRIRLLFTWMKPFNGTKIAYMRFSNDCDRCFSQIDPRDKHDLLHYVISQLNQGEFPIVLGTDYRSWEDLKRLLMNIFKFV